MSAVSVVALQSAEAIELPGGSWSRMLVTGERVESPAASIGYSVFKPGSATASVSHETDEVAYVVSGSGRLDTDDGEVRFVDDQFSRLLDGLAATGRAPRSWVVVTGDHGEEFKDHGSMGHGRRLYEETIHVPLIIGRAAGQAGAGATGRRVAAPVSGIDLFPTIAALAGAAAPAGLQGTSLAPLLGPGGSGSPVADRPLVCETIRLNAHLKALRRGPLKLIQSMDENRTELYDLAADPRERTDLSDKRPDERRAIRSPPVFRGRRARAVSSELLPRRLPAECRQYILRGQSRHRWDRPLLHTWRRDWCLPCRRSCKCADAVRDTF